MQVTNNDDTITKIKIHIMIFISFIILFTLLYKFISGLSTEESIYTAFSFQTFTGYDVDDSKTRIISTIQMFISYIFVIIIMYSILHL